MGYVSWIGSKAGSEKIILAFAAGILTDRRGRVLLQQRADKAVWDIPGGMMEMGESL